MRIKVGQDIYTLPNSSHSAHVIIAIAKAHKHESGSITSPPERNDIKHLWRELGTNHQAFLREISKRPNGISQHELEKAIALDWEGLRGIHNGLARICKRLDYEKPVRVIGYNASNRRYVMDSDVAVTVKKLAIS